MADRYQPQQGIGTKTLKINDRLLQTLIASRHRLKLGFALHRNRTRTRVAVASDLEAQSLDISLTVWPLVWTVARQGYTERFRDGKCCARAASGGDPCVCCASLRDNGFVLGVTVMGVWLACLSAGMQVCGWGCWDWLLTVAEAGVGICTCEVC